MPISGTNERLKQQFDDITTDRTLNGLGSAVATEDTDSDNDPKAAHGKAHAAHGKGGAGGKSVLAGLSGAHEGHIGAFGMGGQAAAGASGTGADVEDAGAADDAGGLHGEVGDLATAPSGDVKSGAPGVSLAGAAPGQQQKDAKTDKDGQAQGAVIAGAPATDDTSSAATSSSASGASASAPASPTTPDASTSTAAASDTSASAATDSATQDASASAESALSALGVTASDPTVQAAEVKLYGDLHAATPDAQTITTDTDNLISAMKAAGTSDQTSQVLQKMTMDPTASINGAAMALLEAAKNGINTDDSGKDQEAAAISKAAIDRKQAIAQQQAALAAQQQAQAAEEAAQNKTQNYTQSRQQNDGSHDSSSGNSGGGGGGATSSTGKGGSSSGSITAPPGAEAGVTGAGHGTPVAWNQFKQMNYGSPTHINNEEETYTTDGSNFKVNADGSATISATWNGSAYNSARVEGPKVGSLPKYISAVVKNPGSQGTWPAFWLCGPNWPVGGEVDMMEQVNGGKLVQSTHTGQTTGNATNNTSTSIEGIDLNSKYNEVGAYITKTGVDFYVNGKKTKSVDMTQADPNWAEHASNMSMIANLAMGGSWPGHAPNTGTQTMEIRGVYTSDTPPDGTSST